MEKEKLLNLTVLVSSKCNLRCKLCATYTPYQGKKSRFYEIEAMAKSIDRFFAAMGKVKLFTINCGEPFMHPRLSDLIIHCQ
jgi:molybdenum cofactor biosynthesis enzyme MoaA